MGWAYRVPLAYGPTQPTAGWNGLAVPVKCGTFLDWFETDPNWWLFDGSLSSDFTVIFNLTHDFQRFWCGWFNHCPVNCAQQGACSVKPERAMTTASTSWTYPLGKTAYLSMVNQSNIRMLQQVHIRSTCTKLCCQFGVTLTLKAFVQLCCGIHCHPIVFAE